MGVVEIDLLYGVLQLVDLDTPPIVPVQQPYGERAEHEGDGVRRGHLRPTGHRGRFGCRGKPVLEDAALVRQEVDGSSLG